MSRHDASSGLTLRHEKREKEVLGALLVYPSVRLRLMGKVRPVFFWDAKHRATFEVMQELVDAAAPIDNAVIADRLEQRRVFSAGDREMAASFLDELTWPATDDAALEQHVATLSNFAMRREVRGLAVRTIESLEDPATAGDELVVTLQRDITNLALECAESDGLLSPLDIITADFGGMDGFWTRSDNVRRLTTGLYNLDALLGGTADGSMGGLKPGNLIVIAARPSMGKTALCLNIARNATRDSERVAAIFSIEMAQAEVLDRLAAAETRLPFERIERGELDRQEKTAVLHALGQFETGLRIDSSGNATVSSVRAGCYRLKAKLGRLDLVCIDYLQLMGGDSRRRPENRQQEVSLITRGLKLLAKELDVPVVVLSQLSRRCEERPDKHPTLSDLRDSGSIEQDADVVAFLYRGEVYDRSNFDLRGMAELDVAKNRNGRTGVVHLAWMGRYQLFMGMSAPAGEADYALS